MVAFSAPLFAPHHRKFIAAATACAVLLALVVGSPPVVADTSPLDPTEAASVTADALPTVQIDGVAWSQAIVGNTVYVGGSFAKARPAGAAAGVNTVTRSNLLAYNLSTGVLVSSFAPSLNGQVRSVAASPDGSQLYIGGDFTRVNGVTRNRIAAFNVSNGTLVTSFNPNANQRVRAVHATNSTVYFGGDFTSVSGAARATLAAVSSAGALQPWAPNAAGGHINAMVVSPDQTKVAVGGSFTTLNGSSNPGYGLGMVDARTNGKSNLPLPANSVLRNAGTEGAITSLASDNDSFYVGGYDFGVGANIEGSSRVSWADGRIQWLEDCHGDTYSLYSTGSLVYKASHAHDCSTVPNGLPTLQVYYHSLAFTKAVKGTLTKTALSNYPSFAGQPAPSQSNWYPTYMTGTYTGQNQATWHVTGAGQYVVFSGEFLRVNNQPQQGLVRFAVKEIAPNKDGPRLINTAFAPSATSRAAGTITVSWPANWDRDNEVLTYRVIRNGASATPVGYVDAASRFFRRPTVTFTDTGLTPGQSYTYSIRAVDPSGNIATSSSVTATAQSGSSLSAYAREVLGDNPQHYWRVGETSGSTAADVATGAALSMKSGVTRNVTGALTGDTDRASRFSGTSSGFGSTTTAELGPQRFTVEAWFKTSSGAGGKVIGFGNSATTNSSAVDRHVYLDTSGRVNFGVFAGSNRTVTSASAFNNGQWHHVAATMSSAGMALYVDGALVGQRADTTAARQATGYWRVGGDASWAGSGYLAGDIDDAAVYQRALSATEIANHFSIGAAAGPVNQAPNASFTTTTSQLTANFNGSGSSDADGTVRSWVWNYGDGTTGTGSTASHAYASAGTFTVTLTVTDDDGATASTTRSVAVSTTPVDPPPATVLAADDFSRTVVGGWGSAATGGPWTITGGSSGFAVGNDVGSMTIPAAARTLAASLPGVSTTASDLTVTTSLREAVTGAPLYVSVLGRTVGSDDYRARMVYSQANGSVTLALSHKETSMVSTAIPGLVYSPGDRLTLRLQVTGTSPTTVRAKVWRAGTVEPSAWLLTTTDASPGLQAAGAIAFSVYLGGASTSVPRTVNFDDLTVKVIG